MRDMAAGPRVLLRRLRELMAEPLEPQERLDRIVREIAANMVAEVCSLYVLRADSVLELYATEGLNPGSVHLAQLKLGRRPGRHDRGQRPAAEPVRRPEASGLRLPAGDRRRDLPLLPRRAGAARRPHARRAGRPEPDQAALPRRRGRGAGNHGDGDRRDDRHRRARTADPARAGARSAPPGELHRAVASTKASASAMSCCTSRASSSPICSTRTATRKCAGSKRRSARSGCRSTTCCRAATSPSRASTATCSRPTACSPTTAAGCAGCDEAIAQRPHRGSGGREGAERHARPHAAA